MATTPEGRVKAAVKALLGTLANCWFYMPVSNGMGTHGIPDFIVCYKGVFVAIETKAPGKLGNVTPLQRMQINRINQALGYAIAVVDVEQVRALFETIDNTIAVRHMATSRMVGGHQ